MRLLDAPWFRKYVIPGAIFQSVLVGGGYGTGREIVEYFTRFGAGGGVLGLGVTVVCWMVVLAVTWEFARVFRVYDYRRFFQRLLGRGWVVFEVLFVVMFVLVLAVVASAAGEILRVEFGVPYAVGIAAMLALVGALAFFGREIVTKTLALWTLFLYGLFALYFGAALLEGGARVGVQLADWEVVPGWARSGFQYAAYNLFIVPALLFSTRDLRTRGEVVGSAVVASVLCALPALLFHISFLGDHPAVLAREIPVGVLRETRGSSLKPAHRAVLAVAGVALSAGLATVGIIRLVAQGYGTLAWGFFAVYVVPVVTIGAWKIHRAGSSPVATAPGDPVVEEAQP